MGLTTPAFGQADLSNCERELIHFAGSIQPHGALILLSEPDLTVVQTSTNASELLGFDDSLIGRTLDELGGDLTSQFRRYKNEALDSVPIALRCKAGDAGKMFDCLLHRPPNGGLVMELEPASAPLHLSPTLADGLERVIGSPTLRALCDETAKMLKAIVGYDRVMVYRFDDDGHGEVFSEEREPALEAFLGNRYPASDIPQMARRLYVRNRVRMLVDVAYEPVALFPRLSPITGEDLDMSLCSLRSMSPIHIQYLKNMGVAATLVISLVVGGKLWGLVACHHYKPRFVQFEIRSACELLAEAIATRIAALESFAQAQAELSVRRLEQRMIDAISSVGDWRGALFDNSTALLQPLGAGGAALLFDGQILTAGDVPGTHDLRDLGRWLDSKPPAPVVATASLGVEAPEFSLLTEVASGLLAAPISTVPGEYIIWFRPERIRTITWGGNPFKPVVVGDDPRDLSPRRSFSQWHQLMEGSCEPWTAADVAAARLIGATVADVVLQFRSVQMLILQDQLDHVQGQVHVAEQPVLIADADGRILLTNEAFGQLARAGHGPLTHLHELADLFTEPHDVRRRLGDLVAHRQTWRGEVYLAGEGAEPQSLLIRADTVYASADRVRGFVLMFTDNTEQKAATSARRRFQEGLIEQHRPGSRQIGNKADLVFHNLMSAVVENAQLAALEITDRANVQSMPELLESVRASVARTAEVLEHLIWHARRRSKF
ncbi:MAG TPA: GAF domain-containing protein [Caulobacteraceae bacterium]|nr:GAF domain-containing protein [Caulobacteraceae bacterium]